MESPNRPATPTGSMTPNGGANVKPALKKNPSHSAGGASVSNPSDPGVKSSKEHIKWDEVIIEEHDKLRGTRQKVCHPILYGNNPLLHTCCDLIVLLPHSQHNLSFQQIDEPNTPYNYDSGAESDGSHPKSPQQRTNMLDFEQLQEKLVDVAAQYPSSPTSSHGDQSDDDEKKRAFVENRKKHYNEIEVVRKFRMEHADDDGDDEGNDADDDMDL